MKQYPATAIRNVAVAGHNGVGKTTLVSALLHEAGAVNRFGRVDDGSAPTDFDPEEIERKISIGLAVAALEWKKHELTLVDTPGYVNFLTDGLNSARLHRRGAGARAHVGGVKVEAERVWSRAEQLGLPVVGFVTKMDRENADFEAALTDVTTLLQGKPVPVQLPIGSAETLPRHGRPDQHEGADRPEGRHAEGGRRSPPTWPTPPRPRARR